MIRICQQPRNAAVRNRYDHRAEPPHRKTRIPIGNRSPSPQADTYQRTRIGESVRQITSGGYTAPCRKRFLKAARSHAADRALASVVPGRARCLTFPRKRFVRDFTSRFRGNAVMAAMGAARRQRGPELDVLCVAHDPSAGPLGATESVVGSSATRCSNHAQRRRLVCSQRASIRRNARTALLVRC
jgi:hypothetical protein